MVNSKILQLVKRGVSRKAAAKVSFSNKGRWALSWTRALHRAYPNRVFINRFGQLNIDIKILGRIIGIKGNNGQHYIAVQIADQVLPCSAGYS
ncbi:MAG: hypothetical protein KAH62_01310 [Desulfobacula sp.]|nr:hypothetical protein [Desulfobacula sp.]